MAPQGLQPKAIMTGIATTARDSSLQVPWPQAEEPQPRAAPGSWLPRQLAQQQPCPLSLGSTGLEGPMRPSASCMSNTTPLNHMSVLSERMAKPSAYTRHTHTLHTTYSQQYIPHTHTAYSHVHLLHITPHICTHSVHTTYTQHAPVTRAQHTCTRCACSQMYTTHNPCIQNAHTTQGSGMAEAKRGTLARCPEWD